MAVSYFALRAANKPHMPNMSFNPALENSAEIGLEVLQRLVQQQIAPTPEAYAQLYRKLAGSPCSGPEHALFHLMRNLAVAGSAMDISLTEALATQDWDKFGDLLLQLIAAQPDPAKSHNAFALFADEDDTSRLWKDLLIRVLSLTLPTLLEQMPALAQAAEGMAREVKTSYSLAAAKNVSGRLKDLCLHIDLYATDASEKHAQFMYLLNLLLLNIAEELEADSWLQQEIASFQNLVAQPFTLHTLEKSIQHLKTIIFKHGQS